MGQFDNVDLGGDATMKRMVAAENKKRNELLDEVMKFVRGLPPDCTPEIVAQQINNLKR